MARLSRTVRVGDLAPDFCLRTIDGEEVCLRDFRGRQAVLLFFFRGTW